MSPGAADDRADGSGTRIASYVGAGCLTAVAGLFGGGMLGVGIGMIVGNARGCKPPPDDFPICDFFGFWIPGMLIGLVLLPSVTLWLMRRSRSASENST